MAVGPSRSRLDRGRRAGSRPAPGSLPRSAGRCPPERNRRARRTMPLPIEPPYPTILTALQEGRVVPFLGAGASLVGRPDDAAWTESAAFLPRGAELSCLLAREAGFAAMSED